MDFLKQEWKNKALRAKVYDSECDEELMSDSSGNHSEFDEIKLVKKAREKHKLMYPNWQAKESSNMSMQEVNSDEEADEEGEWDTARNLMAKKQSS